MAPGVWKITKPWTKTKVEPKSEVSTDRAKTVGVRPTWLDGQKSDFHVTSVKEPGSRTQVTHHNTYYRDRGDPSKSRRARFSHNERARLAPPDDISGRPRLGPIAERRSINKPDITGRISAALEKLFRSKSQKSRRTLEKLQLSLIGHVYHTSSYFRETAKYLRHRGKYIMVYNVPSFKAVRLILNDIKNCDKTTWRIHDVLEASLLCMS